MSGLAKRLLSTAVLAPVMLWILFTGGAVLLALLLAAVVISSYEWAKMAARDKNRARACLLILAGSVYIAAALGGVFDIRETDPVLCFCLLLGIWGSDIGGYVFGKFIGGPKLAPRISPNKTWAGLFGACLLPVIVMLAIPLSLASPGDDFNEAFLLLSGLALGVLGQIGDLSVSKMKRFAGVKDTGSLIPGHGGLLDRIDALLLVFFVFWGLSDTGIMAWPFVR